MTASSAHLHSEDLFLMQQSGVCTPKQWRHAGCCRSPRTYALHPEDYGTRWSACNFTPRYTPDRMLGGSQGLLVHSGVKGRERKKKPLVIAGKWTPVSRHVVVLPYWLSYSHFFWNLCSSYLRSDEWICCRYCAFCKVREYYHMPRNITTLLFLDQINWGGRA